jgi:hypothetical protein
MPGLIASRARSEVVMTTMIRTGLVWAVAMPCAFATAPVSTMLVPSPQSFVELETLSHRTDVTVDIYTVDRQEKRVALDGAGAGALSGQNLEAPAGADAAIRIPFDQVALLYYRAGGMPVREVFPSLPAVGAVEQAMGCDALAIELGRTETIRWWARVPGATPYTSHEIRQQHAHKAELVAGAIVAWPLLLYGAVDAGLHAAVDPLTNRGVQPPPRLVDTAAYRWAVTAADRRELGLLQIKRERTCESRGTQNGAGTDLAVLAGVEDSARALAAQQVTEDEQMAQQTRWLDQLYPSPPRPTIAPLSTSVNYEVEWRAHVDAEHQLMKAVGHRPLIGHLQLHEDGLSFAGKPAFGKNASSELRVTYAELADANLVQVHAWPFIVITYRDGHQDLLAIYSSGIGNLGLAQFVRNQIKSRLTAGP